jgi:hypothetical protein
MKICYFITLYHKFDQAVRLISKLAGPSTSFVLHIDKQAGESPLDLLRVELGSGQDVHFAPRVASKWGSYKGALAIANCIHTAVREIDYFDRCILLSGQDYPICSRRGIFEFFEKNVDLEFIEAFPMDIVDETQPGWSPYYRFRRRHFWIGNRRSKIPILRKGLPDLQMYHGSTWWALSRDAILYLDAEIRRNHRLRRFLKTGFLVEEAYVPTLIMNSSLLHRVAKRNVTFDQWTPTSGPHPKILTESDFEQLMASPKLFARKFDASVDSSILDRLDAF